MKNMWLFILLLFSHSSYADQDNCDLPDGSMISFCETVLGSNGETPNLIIQWEISLQRENGNALPEENVKHTSTYFQLIEENQWTNYRTTNSTTKNLYIYKPHGIYSITSTISDIYGLESKPSDAVVFEAGEESTEPPVDPPIDPPTNPQPPTIITLEIPSGFDADITVFEKEAEAKEARMPKVITIGGGRNQ